MTCISVADRSGSVQAMSSRHSNDAMHAVVRLTVRESAVLRLLARGCTYVRVADELGVSLNTVASHVKNLYRKLGVRSARAAVWRALELHLLPRPQDQGAEASSAAATAATQASGDAETSTVMASDGGSSAANWLSSSEAGM